MDERNNQNTNNSKVDERVQDLKAKLAKEPISPTAFNLMGKIPTKSVFTITVDEMKKAIKDEASRFLKDVYMVTFDCNKRNGYIDTYVWMSAKSSDLVDTSTNNTDNVIKAPIAKLSEQLKAFMAKYCNKEDKRIIDSEGNRNYKAIKINMIKIIQTLFDIDGNQYRKLYNQSTPTRLAITPIYLSPERNEFTRLVHFEVEKSENYSFDKTNLKPRKNAKI